MMMVRGKEGQGLGRGGQRGARMRTSVIMSTTMLKKSKSKVSTKLKCLTMESEHGPVFRERRTIKKS